MNYATPTTYKNSPKHQAIRAEKKTKKPSETVPNEALSMAEMFTRFSRKQTVTGTVRQPLYTPEPNLDDEDFEKLKDADMTVKAEYAARLADDIELIKARDKAAADKAAKDAEELEEKKFLDKLAKHQKKSEPPKKDDGVTPH